MSEHRPVSGHEKIETNNFLMIVLILLVVAVGGLVEIVPLFFQRSTTQPVAGLKPLTALQLAGRDIYTREGCYNCHSQMIRALQAETLRYGHYSMAGEFVYDHPFQWGSRRIGPDLHREGGKRNSLWHLHHFRDPRQTSPGSLMPGYPQLLEDAYPDDVIQSRVDAMAMLGVPYGVEALNHARDLAATQAEAIAAEIEQQGGPPGLGDKEVVALIAYIQRLGIDIKLAPVAGTTEGGK